MPPTNVTEFSVSELSTALRRRLEDDFGHVRVRGEISGLKIPASGHLYMALKDKDSVLDGVAWRGTRRRFRFEPEDGLEVICEGKITTFAGRSKYQIIIERMEPAGAGALMAILEKRRALLEAEGLFAAANKKPLPALPQTIGIVTSPSGAVIRDIIHRIEDRFPVRLILAPVAVQGEAAPAEIVRAIRFFNSLDPTSDIPRPDVLIVGRGGGSVEDLWAFNDEHVIRATAASDIPIISAVGHETDTTLIDFAADQRAPTPTAAAEFAVPVRRDLMVSLEETAQRLLKAVDRDLARKNDTLSGMARGIHDPQWLLSQAHQRLDHAQQRQLTRMQTLIREAGLHLDRNDLRLQRHREGPRVLREAFLRLSAKLSIRPLLNRMKYEGDRLRQFDQRLLSGTNRQYKQTSLTLKGLGQTLRAYDPDSTLSRGYVLVTDDKGAIVMDRTSAEAADRLHLRFRDQDQFNDAGLEVSSQPVPKPKPKRRKSKPAATDKPAQESLF